MMASLCALKAARSFTTRLPKNVLPSGNAGSGLFQKNVASSPFGRPRAVPQAPRMPSFGRVVDKANQEVSDDEIELRPYVPKKK